MAKNTWSVRLMNATGKLRLVFGPADRSTLGGPVKYVDDAAHRARQQQLQQWDVVRNADGSTYLVNKQGNK